MSVFLLFPLKVNEDSWLKHEVLLNLNYNLLAVCTHLLSHPLFLVKNDIHNSKDDEFLKQLL